jgi:hypothetical protein
VRSNDDDLQRFEILKRPNAQSKKSKEGNATQKIRFMRSDAHSLANRSKRGGEIMKIKKAAANSRKLNKAKKLGAQKPLTTKGYIEVNSFSH